MTLHLVSAAAMATSMMLTIPALGAVGTPAASDHDVPAPIFWDGDTQVRVGAEADRFELDQPGPVLSAWYRLSYLPGGDRVRVHEHGPLGRAAPATDMAASERVAWGVAASLAASVPGRDDVPPWARPRTGGAAGTSAGLLFALADLDVLTPGRLAGGLRVAATGSIGADGSVTSVRMMEAKLTAAALAGADVVFAADFPAGAAPFTAVESHVGVPAGDRTIGDWLATDAYEAAGRAAARSGRRALVAVDDVRQAVAWLCGRTNEAATCAVSHTAAAVPLATVRSRSLPAGSGLRLVGAMMR